MESLGKQLTSKFAVLLIVLNFFSILQITAQNFTPEQATKLDSLLTIANNSSYEDTVRADAYNQAFNVYRYGLTEKALLAARKALELSQPSNYNKGIVAALHNIGYYYRFGEVNFDLSVTYFLKALEYAKGTENANLYGTMCTHIGIIYQSQGKLSSALEYFLEASRVLDEEGNYKNSGLGYALIGDLFSFTKNYEKAEKYYHKSIERLKQNKNLYLLESSYQALSLCYIDQELPEKANETRLAGLKAIRELSHGSYNNSFNAITDYIVRAKILHLKNQCNIGLTLLDSAELEAQQTLYKLDMNFYLTKAHCLIDVKKYKSAQNALDLAKTLPKGLHMPETDRDALKLQSIIYEKLGDVDRSLMSYKRYSKTSDSLTTAYSGINLRDLELRLESEKKQRENLVLKMNLDIEQQKAKTQWTLIIASFIIIAIGIFLLLIIISSKARIRKKNILLNEQNKEIQAQNEEIVAQNEEITSQTEQLKQKNSYLEFQNEKLEELNQEKDGLMSIVAHDLRAPLNRTIGLASLLRTRTQFHDEDKNIIDKIIQVSGDGVRLIRDILEINSFQYESDAPSYFAVNLRTFFEEEIIRQFNEQASKKLIRLTLVVDKDIEIFTDLSAIRRVFENLLSNAIKFSPPQTNVTIRATQSHEFVFIGIQDEGPGISADDQRKMFRKFQRLTARPTGGEHSTGLGLSIVKSLVEKLKGEITVESDLDAGTEFIIKIPRRTMIPTEQLSSMAS